MCNASDLTASAPLAKSYRVSLSDGIVFASVNAVRSGM